MALQKLIEYDWFKDQCEDGDLKAFESNFKSSKRTQEAIVMWVDHEVAKLDNELTLTKLKDVPDRAEFALLVTAQKDVLKRIKHLIVEDEHTNGV